MTTATEDQPVGTYGLLEGRAALVTGPVRGIASAASRTLPRTAHRSPPAWPLRTSPDPPGPSTAASIREMREMMEDVFVLSAVRTPIGKYGGGLSSVGPCDLASRVVREAVSRSRVEPGRVRHAVFGNVIHTEVRDMYLSRVAAVDAGLPVGMPALTVNRLCGSGLQAIVSASQAIMLGHARSPWPAGPSA